MANFADKLREESYIALQEAVAHNEKVDCTVLELIYKQCEQEAKKGKFNYSINTSQIKGVVKADYYNKRFQEVESRHISNVAKERREREEEGGFYPDDLSIKVPDLAVEIMKQEAEDFWYHRVDYNEFNVGSHLTNLLEAEGFEVETKYVGISSDIKVTLYWSNDMGGNK